MPGWRRSRREEGGESLIELIVATAILGLGVVAVLGGMATAVLTSALHRSQAEVSTVMTAAAEWVKEVPYRKCAVMTDYLGGFAYPPYATSAAGDTLTLTNPSGTAAWKVSFTIADWNGDSFPPRPPAPDTTCEIAHGQGLRTQLVTITAVTADGKVSQAIPIVKRFRDCPPVTPPNTPGCDTP